MTDSTTAASPTLVVVGGVAGGASAVTRARRMNERATIIMFEKDEHVSFANCGLPYHVGGEIAERDSLFVARPALFAERFNIDVRTRHEVLDIDRARREVTVLNHTTGEQFRQAYDKLILAPGAAPIVPPQAGISASNVFSVRNVTDTDRITAFMTRAQPGRAVVVGAGYIGLEMMEQLHARGVAVTLVELQPQVLPLMDPELAHMLQEEIAVHDIELRLGDGISALVSAEGLATGVVLGSGETIDTDMVILGIGVKPSVQLAEQAGLSLGESGGIHVNAHGQTDDPDIYAVGDACEYTFGPTGRQMRVALAGPANRAGRLAGEHAVTGSSAPVPRAWGTAIVRVFGLAAGMVGLTMSMARRSGLDARCCVIRANHHVGYYPGAQPVTLKLVYDASTGRILGAQAVGREGIDKRVDVIATAMHFGATVHDLTALDLAYAPPFGAAKDPVHMAGFVAANDLAGTAVLMPIDSDLDGYQVLDVRSRDEVAGSALCGAPHAINIPLHELRERIAELDSTQPTVVSCASGARSHVATRILMQRGFNTVYNLSGGTLLRAHALSGISAGCSVPQPVPAPIPAPSVTGRRGD